MKKTLKISAIAILVLFLSILLIPFLFQGKIKEQLNTEINKNLNAKVSFGKVSINLIRHFPDMTFSMKELNIVGIDDFRTDTLMRIAKLSMTIDLGSMISGNEYEIKSIVLDSPAIRLKVLRNGKVNWDIMKPSDTADSETSPSAFHVKLNRIRIVNAEFVYDDAETPMLLSLEGLDGQLKGDMTADQTSLDLIAEVSSLTTSYERINYINQAKARLKTTLTADLAKWKFTFQEAAFGINALQLRADGFFAMPEDGYDMDIKFAAEENDFKAFLSMVPGVYTNNFSQIKTGGTMSFDGFVRGKYTDELMPAFGLNISVIDGNFSYPSLPGNVTEIGVVASISNPDGIPDHTVLDVSKFHLRMMQSPVDAVFSLRNPVSDPEVNATVKGKIDLANISRIYPLDATSKLTGSLDADFILNGKISNIESGNYDKFFASGFAEIHNLNYSTSAIPDPVSVGHARFDFSPANIALSDLRMRIGANDLKADGRIGNYMPYFLRKTAVLTGSLTTSSDRMDLNSLIPSSAQSAVKDTSALSVVEIPGNIDVVLSSSFGRLIYDNYDMRNVAGSILIKDKALKINNLKMQMLGGGFTLNGTYNTFDPEKPKVDMDMKINEVDVKQAFQAFNTIKTFAPVCEKLNGRLTTNLKFNGDLKEDMMPDLASLSGAGLILSNLLSVENINTFNVIADVLKIEKLRRPSIEKINLSFDLVDGKATVKPMDFKLASYKSNFSGTIGLDQAINFILTLDIPRADFGGSANNVLNGLVSDASKKGMKVSMGDVVPVTLLIGGTVRDPKVTAGIKQALSGVVEDLKQQAIAQVQKKKEEVVAKAKDEANKLIEEADAQAAKVIAAARQQSDALLKSARSTSDKMRAQADSVANKVIAEGKKNGMLAELAAKKSAEKIRKEADTKAGKVMEEAKIKSDAILNKANEEAARLKQQARERTK
jgi:cell division septum initiation protein DivIVA